MSRIFIGISLPNEIKEKIENIKKTFRQSMINAKWVEKENMHITLKFLGEIPEEKVANIAKIIAKTSKFFKPIILEIEGIGAFPNMKKPSVLWIGISKGNEEIIKYQNLLETNLVDLGFPKDTKSYHSHITIARIKNHKNVDKLTTMIKEIKLGQMTFDKVDIIKSTLTPQGSIYNILEQIKL